MTFSSWQFLAFFPIVGGLYFATPHKWRWCLLLLASYFFYMCSIPGYAILLAGSTVIDYSVALWMPRLESVKRRRLLLGLSLTTNLGLLCLFKYFNFFSDSIAAGLSGIGVAYEPIHTTWLLPVGISFYTFQTLSYSIDVYRGHQEPERHFGRFALFVSFFPQLVAGPIERSTNLLPQFRKRIEFDYQRVISGLTLMGWGAFKKMVIADRLALLVNSVYDNPDGLAGVHYIAATVCFAIQIYCDFSGYSDMAIGAAEVLGFRLMKNFNRPYSARSLADFWSRWHISLSTWFRDYVYIPLGGNRVAVPRWYLNLMIVFLVSGLWHGARWTYVVWGGLHGAFLVGALITKPYRERVVERLSLDTSHWLFVAWQRVFVFTLVCLTWVFFRANSVPDALSILSRLGTGWGELYQSGQWLASFEALGLSEKYLISCGLLILLLEIVQHLQSKGDWQLSLSRWPTTIRWACYVGLALAILNLGAPTSQQFIYFQF